jgi:hypothetical protein
VSEQGLYPKFIEPSSIVDVPCIDFYYLKNKTFSVTEIKHYEKDLACIA